MTGRNETDRAQEAQQALGAMLRQYRKRGGLTQEELAERAGSGLSVYTISNVERGRTRPSRHTLQDVMAALELDDVERRELQSLWREAGILPAAADSSTSPGLPASRATGRGDEKAPPPVTGRLPAPPVGCPARPKHPPGRRAELSQAPAVPARPPGRAPPGCGRTPAPRAARGPAPPRGDHRVAGGGGGRPLK